MAKVVEGGGGAKEAAKEASNEEIVGYEERAGFCGRLTISWFTNLMMVARRKTLEEEDLACAHRVGTANDRCDAVCVQYAQ